MLKILKNSWALFAGYFILMIAHGFQGNLLGVRSVIEEFNFLATGAIMSGYFIGYFSGANSIPKFVGKVGHIRVFAAFASMASLSILLHAIFVNPIIWTLARFISGFSIVAIFIVMESWLNDRANNRTRGQLLSIYMFITLTGLALGTLLLNFSSPEKYEPFILISLLLSSALIPILLTKRKAPKFKKLGYIDIKGLYKTSPLATFSMFCTGLIHSALFSLGAVYAAAMNFTLFEISLVLFLVTISGGIFQWPIGYYSDKSDRRIIIIFCTFGADINMLEFEPRRYMSWVNKDYAIKKSSDQYRRMYFTPLPNESIEVGRPMKKTPIYNKLKESGAIYLDSYGWEKPCWFAKKGMKEEYSFKRTNAFTYVQKECENVQNNVGILDLSTFAKYEISGKDSETFLERLCANRIPKKEGSIILTHMLNSKGRIQSELTITRFPNNIFYVLSSTASEIRDFDWFNKHLHKGENVNIKNVTKDYGVLVLAGPKSRKVLSQLTSQNLNNNDFPWLKGKEILINKIPVKALRVNYVGELGWELHHPMNQMESLYDLIYEVGKKENIINFGTYAVNSLRMEKAYRGWGTELTGEISLVEAGMDRFFNLKKKNNFFGAKALQNKIQSGVDVKIVYLEVDVDKADARGNEPIYYKNKIVGVVTSGGYGFRTKKSLAFAYVSADLTNGKNFEIEIQGERRKAKILDKAVYDPDNKKLKA